MVIKELIKKKGYTIKKVAEKMGVNRVTLMNQLAGNPTVRTLEKIASAIGCSVSDFFSDEVKSSEKRIFSALVCDNGTFYSAGDPSELKKITDKILSDHEEKKHS
jgi:transcriptional regulator with XRE-family HTH domain